jgi:hypothetical protein
MSSITSPKSNKRQTSTRNKDKSKKSKAGSKTTGLPLLPLFEIEAAASLISTPSPSTLKSISSPSSSTLESVSSPSSSTLKRQKIAPGSGFGASFAKKFNKIHYEKFACGSFAAYFEKPAGKAEDPYWSPSKFKVKTDEEFRNCVNIDSFLPMCGADGEQLMCYPGSTYKWEQIVSYSMDGKDILMHKHCPCFQSAWK